jgi:hypothetical protein
LRAGGIQPGQRGGDVAILRQPGFDERGEDRIVKAGPPDVSRRNALIGSRRAILHLGVGQRQVGRGDAWLWAQLWTPLWTCGAGAQDASKERGG